MLKAKMKMHFVPNVYTRGFVCVLVLIQLICSLSESTTKSSLFLDFEEDERQLSGGGVSSSINTKSFLRSHDENKHEQQEYTRSEVQEQHQPRQIDVIPISLEEDNTRLIRNGGHATSLEVQNDELQQQDERQMLWLRKYTLCVKAGSNKWETITTRSRLVRAFYLGRGAVSGTCGDQCDTVCEHEPCFDDYKVSLGGILCTCLEDPKPLCGANAKCAASNEKEDVCACKEGYTGNATAGCTDLNECSTNICGTTSTACTNTEGSYDCTCQSGYAYNKTNYGSGCVDFNECSAGTNLCGPNAKCSNDVGGFSCTCDTGYQGSPPSTQCTDVDECSANPTRCGADASIGTCVNTPGSVSCSCAAGYTWPNPNGPCTDINECSTPNRCGANENCVNAVGSFSCECKPGFVGNPSAGQPCVDICSNGPCGPNAKCTISGGSFSCACDAGYQGNPPSTSCTDIDECTVNPTRCGADASVGTCSNTAGGFTCSCAAGYTWPNPNGPCTDINECSTPNRCGATESCVNTPGSFQCVCKSGFTGNPSAGQPCVDANECLDTVNPVCGPNSQCTNTVGNFTCKCNSDFPGGNPPKEQCRKLIERETCPQGSATLCNTGLECASVSRSDTTNFICCSKADKCFTTQRCCNGSYDEGQPCPSGSNLDCSGDLVCERESVISARTVCCKGTTFVFGIGNICDLF